MKYRKTILILLCLNSDEDLPGDHLLAEASLQLKKLLQQAQKKFQIPLEKPNLKVSREKFTGGSGHCTLGGNSPSVAKEGRIRRHIPRTSWYSLSNVSRRRLNFYFARGRRSFSISSVLSPPTSQVPLPFPRREAEEGRGDENCTQRKKSLPESGRKGA